MLLTSIDNQTPIISCKLNGYNFCKAIQFARLNFPNRRIKISPI